MLLVKTVEAAKRLDDGCMVLRLNGRGPRNKQIYFILTPMEFTVQPGMTLTLEMASDTVTYGRGVHRFRLNAGPWLRADGPNTCTAGSHCDCEFEDIMEPRSHDAA